MCFGTQNGLNKYDGYTFTTYRLGINKENGLIDEVINHLSEDENKNILICTSKGIDLLKRNKNSIEHLGRFPKQDYQCLVCDNKNNLWLGTRNGLFLFNPYTDSLLLFIHKEEDKNSLINNSITAIFEDSNYNLWIGTRYGLNLFNPDKTFERYISDENPNSLSANEVSSITEDKGKNLWIGSRWGGTDIFVNAKDRPKTGIFRRISVGDVYS
jgi:ligand-binding sensor domain-containing protein